MIIWVTSFEWIERLFGYGGLCMLVFAVAAVKSGPDWAEVGKGFVPHIAQNNTTLYLYFVIGLLGAAMTPYEVYFYSSGGVEEEWGPKDIGMNRANAIVGYGLGGTLSIALMIVGATVFLGHGISPEHLGTIALGAGDPLGKIGLLLALVGILFAVGGASIDTVFAGAYNLAQFCGWEWGRYRHPKGAPRFALTWFILLILAMGIVMTGVDPVASHRVRGHLLCRCASAHLPPDPARRERPRVHGPLRQRSACERARGHLPRRDHGDRADGDSVDDPDERWPELTRTEFDIGLHVLDHQLLDKNGRRCGNVDDLAIEGGAGEVPEVVAILAGPGYWGPRAGWIGRLAGWVGGGGKVRVDWSEVEKIDSAVRLKHDAHLTRPRRRRRPPAAVPREDPGSRQMRTLSSLQRRKVETESGRALGRCHDLRGELTETKLRVTGLCVGPKAWLSHLGVRSHDRHTVIPWQAIVRIEGTRIVVRDDAI